MSKDKKDVVFTVYLHIYTEFYKQRIKVAQVQNTSSKLGHISLAAYTAELTPVSIKLQYRTKTSKFQAKIRMYR
jgi:hypothetical protein